ncbi:LPXTG cell wall anchor domain-containing protein [Arcanobacterium hippocoleae]
MLDDSVESEKKYSGKYSGKLAQTGSSLGLVSAAAVLLGIVGLAMRRRRENI